MRTLIASSCGACLGSGARLAFEGRPSATAAGSRRRDDAGVPTPRVDVAASPAPSAGAAGCLPARCRVQRRPSRVPHAGPATSAAAAAALRRRRSDHAVEALVGHARRTAAGKALARSNMPPSRAMVAAQWKLGAHVCRRRRRRAVTTSRRSSISAGSPTATPTTIRGPQARFVANAFVALGHYYRDGIPNST